MHVWKADTEVVIELATIGEGPWIREIAGMRSADVTQAFWNVE